MAALKTRNVLEGMCGAVRAEASDAITTLTFHRLEGTRAVSPESASCFAEYRSTKPRLSPIPPSDRIIGFLTAELGGSLPEILIRTGLNAPGKAPDAATNSAV